MLDFARPAGVARRYLRWRLLLVITGSLIAIALAPATVRALPRWAQLLWVAWALAAALSYVLGRGASPGVQRRLQLLVSLVDAPSIALLTAAGGVGTSLAAPLLAINVAASGGRLGPRAGTALLALCEASLIVAWLPTLVAPGTRLAPILVVALVLQGLTLVVLAVFQGMASRIARASREQWVRLFDAVPDLIFVLDRNAEVLLANRAAERITGYDQATLRGGRLARFMPEESRSAAIARMDRTLAGEPMVYEATARRADGSPLHTRLHTVPLVEDGVISGALAVVHDLTAQKRDAEERERMAQALEESRRLLEGIVRTQASGLYLFDLAGRRATFMNDAMQELLGLDVARLAAMTHAERRETIHADDRETVRRAIAHVVTLDDDARIEVEYRLRDRHGRWRWVSDRLGIFERDAAGVPTVLLGSGIDVTERKASVEALRRSEQRYRALVEHYPLGSVILFDDQLRITLADGQGVRRAGLGPGDLLGQEVGVLLDETEAAKARAHAARALQGEESQYELHLHGRTYDMRVVPIREPDGAVRAAMALSSDVTESRRADEERRQRVKMEAVGTLAGGIAHDFNNILASIMGYAELILLDAHDERVRDDIQQVLVAAGRGRQLVQRILAFSRSGQQERLPVAVGPIVDEAVRLLRPTLPRGVDVRVQVDDALPAVLGDPLELHQVVVNLCGNALHAMRETGGTLEVGAHAVATPVGAHVQLVVRDSGAGMPADVRERAFDPFFTTKPPGEGSGMGLAMVHGIVSAMQGTIALQSEPGRGTTVTIELPAAGTGVAGTSVAQRPVALPGGTERILVIDDEPAVARFIGNALERLGYRVTIETDAEAAAARLGTREPGLDLVVCDMTMPRLSGEQLLAISRAAHPALPVLLCTGWSASMTPERAEALGAKALLPKPVPIEQLASAVRAALDGRAARH